MTRMQRLGVIIGLLVLLVALDQATKYMALLWLRQRNIIAFPAAWFPHDLFRFQFATNTGAFLSLGSSLGEAARFWLLTGANALILLGLSAFLLLRKNLPGLVTLSLTLILAGGIGNLIDRVFRDGVVIDFMNIGIGYGDHGLRSGIFNIADLAIVFGLLFLLLAEWRRGAAERKATAEATAGEE